MYDCITDNGLLMTTQMEILKPCPFCGGADEYNNNIESLIPRGVILGDVRAAPTDCVSGLAEKKTPKPLTNQPDGYRKPSEVCT